jgi:hypothetical protein
VSSVASAASHHSLSRSAAGAAFTGLVATAFLLIGVVGSGIMAERLCGGNVGLALLANAAATGGVLVALILAYITGAHWFTASTSFANPVTIARAMTDSFAGIRPLDAPGFTVAQLVGLALALPLLRGMR